MVGQDREETTFAAGEVGANQADDAVTQREPRSHCGIHDDVPRIDLPRKEDRRAVARERHGLFRCGTFAAARVRRPSIQNIRERYSDHVPPGPNTWRLNILPLGQFRPHRGFLSARSTLPSSVARLLHTAGQVACLLQRFVDT